MKRPTTILLLALALTFGVGCPDRKEDANLTPEQRAEKTRKEAEKALESVVKGQSIAAKATGAGIGTARALREAGRLTPDFNLKLAKGALVVNASNREIAEFLLDEDAIDEAGRVKLSGLITNLFDAASRIEQEQRAAGLIKPGDDEVLIFNLGITSGRLAAQIAFEEFGDKTLPGGFVIPVTPATKTKLRGLLPLLDDNETRLKDAISRLQ